MDCTFLLLCIHDNSYWMADLVNFTLLGAKFFISWNIFSFLLEPSKIIWKQISNLLLNFVRWDQSRPKSKDYLDLTEVKYLWAFNPIPDVLWDFSSLAIGNVSLLQLYVSSGNFSPAHLQCFLFLICMHWSVLS